MVIFESPVSVTLNNIFEPKLGLVGLVLSILSRNYVAVLQF